MKNWQKCAQGGPRLLRSHQLPTLSAAGAHVFPPLVEPPPLHLQPNVNPPFLHDPPSSPESDPSPSIIVTSLAVTSAWVVTGLSTGHLHVFSATTGVLARTLVGHQNGGVWAVGVVERARGVRRKEKGKQKEGSLSYTSECTDQEPTGYILSSMYEDPPETSDSAATDTPEGEESERVLVVSGGGDKVIKVWDVLSG